MPRPHSLLGAEHEPQSYAVKHSTDLPLPFFHLRFSGLASSPSYQILHLLNQLLPQSCSMTRVVGWGQGVTKGGNGYTSLGEN